LTASLKPPEKTWVPAFAGMSGVEIGRLELTPPWPRFSPACFAGMVAAMSALTASDLAALDAADPLARFRDAFDLPEGVVYLAGNSLGPPPRVAAARLDEVVRDAWGGRLVRAWTEDSWIEAPARVGGKIARLIGAAADEVIVADSTSVDLFKLIVAALEAAPGRGTLLGVKGEFPTDVYIAERAAALTGRRLRLVERAGLEAALDEDVALLVLTHSHYRTAELFDMAAVNAAAHAAGALVLWDLSHSAGVAELDLDGSGADLAVGCGYKYLNGGPGAPAYLYVARRHQPRLSSPLTGWMGHAAPFDFADAYAPAPGVGRFLCGTPPILSLAALEAAIDLMLQAEPAAMAQKARRLGDVFLELAAGLCPPLEPICPGPGRMRGGHVAFRCPDAPAVLEALIARGVIADFRGPDVLRFGLSPLYVSYADVGRAVQALAAILKP
jgi:kynureninase